MAAVRARQMYQSGAWRFGEGYGLPSSRDRAYLVGSRLVMTQVLACVVLRQIEEACGRGRQRIASLDEARTREGEL